MHFRVFDLAAERCIWSAPPVDMVPVKLLAEKLIVRCFDPANSVTEVAVIRGAELKEFLTQSNQQFSRLTLAHAADNSYAGRVAFLSPREKAQSLPNDQLASDHSRLVNLVNDLTERVTRLEELRTLRAA
jgi:hypothetical protein